MLLYYIHFKITGDRCSLIGSHRCDLFTNRTLNDQFAGKWNILWQLYKRSTNQPNQWFTVTTISQRRWYGRGKANQQLDRDNYFLVHSGWNLKSNLLIIPPGFNTKTKNKEISQGTYNTSGDLPLKARRLTIPQLQQIPLHTGGRITYWETVPQAAPRHIRARRESFLEWKSVESVLVVTLSSQSLWRQCHAMVFFSICHAIFIGFDAGKF